MKFFSSKLFISLAAVVFTGVLCLVVTTLLKSNENNVVITTEDGNDYEVVLKSPEKIEPVTDEWGEYFKNKERYYIKDKLLNGRFSIPEYNISLEAKDFPEDTYYIIDDYGSVHFSSTDLYTEGGEYCIVSGAMLVVTNGSTDPQDRYFDKALDEYLDNDGYGIKKIDNTYYIKEGPQATCSDIPSVINEQSKIAAVLGGAIKTIKKEDANTNSIFTSPVKNTVVFLGDSVFIRWDQNKINATQVFLIPVSEHLLKAKSINIYNIQDLNDAVYLKGEYTLNLPNNLSYYPGFYKVKIFDFGSKNSFESDVFEIRSKKPLTHSPLSSKPYMEGFEVSKQGSGYMLNIDWRGADGLPLKPEDNWKSSIRPLNDKGIVAADGIFSGSYSFSLEKWIHTIPDFVYENFDTYQFQTWCSNLSIESKCAQEYINLLSNGDVILNKNIK